MSATLLGSCQILFSSVPSALLSGPPRWLLFVYFRDAVYCHRSDGGISSSGVFQSILTAALAAKQCRLDRRDLTIPLSLNPIRRSRFRRIHLFCLTAERVISYPYPLLVPLSLCCFSAKRCCSGLTAATGYALLAPRGTFRYHRPSTFPCARFLATNLPFRLPVATLHRRPPHSLAFFDPAAKRLA